MNKKQKAEIYSLQAQLECLKEEMGRAMQSAYIPYVMEERLTDRMERVLDKFYEWASRANAAGMR